MSFLSKVNGAHSLVRIHSPSLLYLLVLLDSFKECKHLGVGGK